MILLDAIEELARELALPERVKEERGGVYKLPLGGELVVEIQEYPPGFALFAKVGPNLDHRREEWYIHLLRANLLGQATGGGSLGLTPDGNYLTLSFSFAYPFSYDEFRDHLEGFFNSIDYWVDERDLFQKGKLKV